MQYELMQKDNTVAVISISMSGFITEVHGVLIPERMPLGTNVSGEKGVYLLQNWWGGRCIPASRSGVRNLLEALDISDTSQFLTKSMGLSLSDQYWVREEGSELRWKDVNFFENPFSDDIGDLLFSMVRKKGPEFSFSSPDNTSDGVLIKRWKIINGKFCLIKGGSGTLKQEPLNERIASVIMDALGIDHVDYEIQWDGNTPYSVCEDFIDTGTELVSAKRLLAIVDSDESVYRRYVKVCSNFGIDVVPALDRMMVIDYIMCNNDRHTNNFGLIRDVESLEFLKPAPIFDTGSSLGASLPTDEISKAAIYCKPFCDTFDQQMNYVSDMSWIDFDALSGIMPEVKDILSSSKYMGEGRTEAVCSLLSERIGRLERLSHVERGRI